MSQRPTTIPGTKRQTVTAADGTSMQRSYVYLPSHVWNLLQELARVNDSSVSQVIQSFAVSGTASSKDKYVSPVSRSTK